MFLLGEAHSAATTLSIAALREPLIRMVVVEGSPARAWIRLAWSAKCRPAAPNASTALRISGPTA